MKHLEGLQGPFVHRAARRRRLLRRLAALAALPVGLLVWSLGSALAARRAEDEEAAAIGALKTLWTAQTRFREGDLERDGVLDYGTLAELEAAGLVGPGLGGEGYRLEVRVAPGELAQWKWMALATPEGEGRRAFATNHAGVIRYEPGLALRDDCELPGGLRCACGLPPGTPH